MNANSVTFSFLRSLSRLGWFSARTKKSLFEIRVSFSGFGEWAFRDSGIENSFRRQLLNDKTIVVARDKIVEGESVWADYFVSEEFRGAKAKLFDKRTISLF